LNDKCSHVIACNTTFRTTTDNLHPGTSYSKELNGNIVLIIIILIDQVGTKRDKTTLDDTTNRINKLLYKVNLVK
jgi:hypothetical protein